ncbi:MAG: MBL fold metallo-hydrolase [Cyanobacteriota bacterium]
MSEKISIKFLGGAGSVTGSKHLISVFGKNILIDCGMFQGLKKLRLLNWEELPFDVSKIDLILLTHGHLDHTGYLPRIVKDGFKGKIMGTSPTLQIAQIILKDSAKIQEEDAERANDGGYSKHKPAVPLYDSDDVENTLKLFNPQHEGQWIQLFDGIKARFNYVGHILGACFIELDLESPTNPKLKTKKLIFSGDIGRENDILLNSPKKPKNADIIFIESTYGDRFHPINSEKELIKIVKKNHDKNGTLIIPSFAVERTQSIMYLLWKLQKDNIIPDTPLYLDSPMGNNVLDVFNKNPYWHKLSFSDSNEMSNNIKYITSLKQTFKLCADKSSKIIIAGSGMGSGGRVLNYFESYLSNKSATILLVGYQAEGTRGRQLMEGIHEIKVHGKYYPVKAKIENLQGLSAHADQKELLNWLGDINNKPEKVFIVHGEPNSSDKLRLKISETYGWNCIVPSLNEVYESDFF